MADGIGLRCQFSVVSSQFVRALDAWVRETFQNGTERWVGGPYGRRRDPFGECRFLRVDISLGYDVHLLLKSVASLFVSMILLPLCRARR